MGIKTPLTLKEAQKLFADFDLQRLIPTKDGVIDTTYIAIAAKKAYILKKYERSIDAKIAFDTKLLQKLHHHKLNVPLLLAQNKGWYLYTKLSGSHPKQSELQHIQLLARAVAHFHQCTQDIKRQKSFLQNYSLHTILNTIKTKHYSYYKKLSSLTRYKQECDGFIHGDIFKDNTLFEKNSVGLFDFIDGGCGSFAFELGVIEISFNPNQKKSFTKMLLRTYNQTAPKKITPQELALAVTNAAKLYALLRISHHKSTKRAKELLSLI